MPYQGNHLETDKEYLDSILKECDPNILLDEEQREVILSDEDYTLVIAGAGAGKTTTVSAKAKYLVDKMRIDPKDILIISFTNKAVDELKERINRNLELSCPITTFHSAGNAIIRKETAERVRISNEGFLFNCISNYLSTVVANNPNDMKKLLLFFSYYIDVDLNLENKENYKNELQHRMLSTIKSTIEDINDEIINQRVKLRRTITNERVRSVEEAHIANFLYMNGIEYEYEAPYMYNFQFAKKIYCPDFCLKSGKNIIYLEHFGINEDGTHSFYSDIELGRYKQHIKDKIRLHQDHSTKLIYTYSKYVDGTNLIDNLKIQLEQNGVILIPRKPEEVYNKLKVSDDNRYFKKMIKLLMVFINNFKTKGNYEEDFSTMYRSCNSQRNKVFLEIAERVYLYYQNQLKEHKLVDFQDLINDSKKILDNVKNMNEKLSFKYIIVDEYQDISLQRFDLTKRLSEVTNAKVIAVGDDWQCIYAFAGSELPLFTKFEQSMGYANIIKIIHTYRNSQELIDIAGGFIQKNDGQIKKELISPKTLSHPVAIFTYSDDQSKNESKGKSGILQEKAKVLDKVLSVIKDRQPLNKKSTVLLIGRFGFDGANLGRTSLFSYDEVRNEIIALNHKKMELSFLTAHSSKGLGFDDVVIINGEIGLWGFPSEKIHDPVLNMVITNDYSYEYAEERRLFYVALTRTKNRVYIICPKNNPSRFVIEILSYSNVFTDHNFSNVDNHKKKLDNSCPVCGFPIYLMMSKAYDTKMYVCSNEPEVCGFVSNNMHGGKTCIRKCPECIDGYLFVKKVTGKESYFLGCTNYKTNGNGCNHSQALDFNSCLE